MGSSFWIGRIVARQASPRIRPTCEAARGYAPGMRRVVCFFMLALTGVAACSPSVNPATGRREIILMSPEQERQIDETESRRIEAQMGLVSDERLTDYVDAIGQALASHSPRQDVTHVFSVIEANEPNAFALPGGHIYISRGLITVSNSEAEIANVLGHEIGHVAARHAAQRQAHLNTFGLASLLTDLLNGGAQKQPDSENISGHFVARYARNQEREADVLGQQLAVDAGVDPRGLASFMRTLDNLTKVELGFSVGQGYFSTHPASQERMLDATTRAQERRWRAPIKLRTQWTAELAVAQTRDAFLARIEGMSVERPASEGVFVGDRFLHADLGFSLRFPHGWAQSNQAAQVVAISPRGDGVAVLQLDRPGKDPEATALDYAEREKLELQNESRIRVGGLPAYRAEASVPTSFGRIFAEITWIAHGGNVYRLLSGMREGSLAKYQGLFRKFSHSFRPLTAADRADITELRLRVVKTRTNETLRELSERTGNEWTPVYTAVANGLTVGARQQGGIPVKVAIRELYVAPPKPSEASR
jgi:predicted Zn-dependent protease